MVLSPIAAEARMRLQKAEGWDLLKVHPGLKREVYDAMAKTADEVGIRFAGHIPADVSLVHAMEKRQETVDHLDGYIEVLKALNDGGVTILFGTDAPQEFSVPGFSIQREMQANVAAGLTPYEVLRSATKNVGENLGPRAKDKFGLVATGHRADLVLLAADPLADIAEVAKRAGVMVRGRWLSEADIQTRLAKIAAERK